MAKTYRARIFKYGSEAAIRLPKALGFGVGVLVNIERRGDSLVIRRVRDEDGPKGSA